jgi:phage terminase large subunit
MKVSLGKIIGKGYKRYWEYKGRYRVVKGGRGSKKSTTTALNIISRMMEYPLANTLVLRKVFKDHRDSTWKQLKWATQQLKVAHLWEFSKAPLEARYIPTGQSIYFRGLDDPMSVTSITVEKGHLCWAWFEEAYQVTNEDDFDKIDMSIRGELPPGYFKQITISFNPWNERHWLKKRFFDVEDEDVLALTTNYLCNEFLGEDDINLFNKMRTKQPKRYQVEGLGNWGVSEGLIYDNWEEKEFDYMDIVQQRSGIVSRVGLDFGYVADPTGLVAVIADNEEKEIFIYDEHYQQGMRNNQIAEMIKYKGLAKEHIIADSAEPKSIDEIRLLGVYGITGAQKGRDSILNGIQFIQQFKIYVHPKCVNTILELSSYVWDKGKDGQQINKPIDYFNHILDALRYAVEDLGRQAQPRVRGL